MKITKEVMMDENQGALYENLARLIFFFRICP